MNPIQFKEATKVLSRPAGMTDEACGPLSVYYDPKSLCCLSCWRPSFWERLSILLFGRVWVFVYSGATQPPIAIEGRRTMFEKPVKKDSP
jgi:hypothetical protein